MQILLCNEWEEMMREMRKIFVYQGDKWEQKLTDFVIIIVKEKAIKQNIWHSSFAQKNYTLIWQKFYYKIHIFAHSSVRIYSKLFDFNNMQKKRRTEWK